MDEVEALIAEVAERAIMPRFRSLDDHEISQKTGAMDLVTVADQEAEELLTAALEKMVPGSKVIGEEAVSAGAVSLDLLREDGPFWLVDPVDGTFNFVQGRDRFGVMVALLEGGEVIQSWITHPAEGVSITAEKGSGAFLDGDRLEAPSSTPFFKARGDYSHTYVQEPYRSAFIKAVETAGPVRQGKCSAYAYTDLARGRLDYVLQFIMTPWDHAPGQLIVEETGGRFAFLAKGERYTPLPRNATPMLVTANGDDWPDYAERFSAALTNQS
jgi:fructose-1,6-bisphosphatase/inositol monophosphatase family enzyme